MISLAATFNEPNIPMLLRWVKTINLPFDVVIGMAQQAAQAVGSDRFGSFLLGNAEKLRDVMIACHHRASAALKSGPGKYPVGVTIAMQDEQAAGPESKRDKKCAEVYGPWLAVAAESDFLRVQTYTRSRVGKDGDLPPEKGIELTQMGYEFWPEALEQTIRYGYAQAQVPIYITENGISTEDDSRRIEYIDRWSKKLPGGQDRRSRLHSLVAARQLRVVGRLPPEVRLSGGRSRNAEAYGEAKRAISGRHCQAERFLTAASCP